jgi:hypothetical protein
MAKEFVRTTSVRDSDRMPHAKLSRTKTGMDPTQGPAVEKAVVQPRSRIKVSIHQLDDAGTRTGAPSPQELIEYKSDFYERMILSLLLRQPGLFEKAMRGVTRTGINTGQNSRG